MRAEDIGEILGFNVPDLLGADGGLRVIEMSVVARLFVLDFAGAYLNKLPEFSDEIWTEWEAEKREMFGSRWQKVQMILAALRKLDITCWIFPQAISGSLIECTRIFTLHAEVANESFVPVSSPGRES